MTTIDNQRVIIVGAGFSGLAVAIALREAGIDDFVILEKGDTIGGTWRDNTYPGCACDVPSQLYSFSYAPKNDWSRVFAEQPEIQEYIHDVATELGIERHIRVGCEARHAAWNDREGHWEVDTTLGPVRAPFLVAGAGPLHTPSWPEIPGLDGFTGTTFHTARWNHEHDLKGRRVAVIGTGASAIQVVPKIREQVEHLTLFQRTPPWVLPKPDHAIPAVEKAAFAYVPFFRRAYRGAIYALLEIVGWAQRDAARMKTLEALGHWHLGRQIRDPDLRARVTPSFALGCKRILMSNTYYPALEQPNVTVTSAAVRCDGDALIDADGEAHRVDTIIFASGFNVLRPPIADRVVGRDGTTLGDVWGGSPTAYLGTTVPGFPNLFVTLGPNLGNGHTSALVLLEAQAGYIVAALRAAEEQGARTLEVRAPVEETWNDQVQEALGASVWNAGGCASWYLDDAGKNRAIYPWSTLDLRRRMARFDTAAYHLRSNTVVAITGGARGIGRATAEAFLREGARVCIGDLDLDAAQQTASEIGARAYRLDVGDAASVRAFVAAVERDCGPLEVLVNNAGIAVTGPFVDESDAATEAALRVNVLGVAHGMRAAIPGMTARRSGHIINIASLAGRLPVPGLATYVASKHAVVGLSATVRQELEGTGVSLTAILPTVVRTRLAQGFSEKGTLAVSPEAVAEAAVRSWRRPEPEVVVPRRLDLVTRLRAVLPASVERRIFSLLGSRRILDGEGTDQRARALYDAEVAKQWSGRIAS